MGEHRIKKKIPLVGQAIASVESMLLRRYLLHACWVSAGIAMQFGFERGGFFKSFILP